MTKETVEILKLVAAEGMTLTNGQAFGKTIYLGNQDKAENWQEIPDTQAESLQKTNKPEEE